MEAKKHISTLFSPSFNDNTSALSARGRSECASVDAPVKPKTARRVFRLQHLIKDCHSLHENVYQTFKDAKSKKNFHVGRMKILNDGITIPKPPSFWKVDKNYLDGKTKITRLKKKRELEAKRKDLDPLSWDNFALTSREFQKREFGKVNEAHKNDELLDALMSPRYIFAQYMRVASPEKHEGNVQREHRIIFGTREKAGIPSWFDRKMKRDVTKTLKVDFPIEMMEQHITSDKEKENDQKSEDADFDFLFPYKNIDTLKYKMRLEKMVGSRHKKEFLRPSSHFQVISPSTLKLFGKEKIE
ncbi:unnamed protein product [Blepharisma stoltei]|uniref:Uncharacterized protein n=1 Tax=Blepharisma stoltei TaxID=1481888 RepID=A0AAU9K0B7_9CILI|nr:unnamed protein product [Blepharisma stoltei]